MMVGLNYCLQLEQQRDGTPEDANDAIKALAACESV